MFSAAYTSRQTQAYPIPTFSGPQFIIPMSFVPYVVISPTEQLLDCLPMRRLQAPGAYLFVRPGETPNEPVEIYCGEGRNVARRLASRLEEWSGNGFQLSIVACCDHPGFDKACAEALEHRLLAAIEAQGGVRIVNRQSPKRHMLDHDRDRALSGLVDTLREELQRRGCWLLGRHRADFALGQLRPEVRISTETDTFGAEPIKSGSVERQPRTSVATTERSVENVRSHRLLLNYRGLTGEAVEADGSFVVKAGTQMSASSVANLHVGMKRIRDGLIDERLVIRPRGEGHWRFRSDWGPVSRTRATQVVTGSTMAWDRVWRPAPAD